MDNKIADFLVANQLFAKSNDEVAEFPFLTVLAFFAKKASSSPLRQEFYHDRGYVGHAETKSGFWDPKKDTIKLWSKETLHARGRYFGCGMLGQYVGIIISP